MKRSGTPRAVVLALGLVLLGSGCTTTYDSQGRPVQTVTPEGAALGLAAAGLVGYAIAKDRYDDDHKYHHHRRKKCHHDRYYW